jgi:sulfur carrier protein
VKIRVNDQPREVPADSTLADLLAELGAARRGVAVEVNGEIVPAELHAVRLLGDGDRVEVVTLVGGG